MAPIAHTVRRYCNALTEAQALTEKAAEYAAKGMDDMAARLLEAGIDRMDSAAVAARTAAPGAGSDPSR